MIWLNEFEEFLEKKRNEGDIKKWIHTVIFCISAEGNRIEPFEKKVLNFLRREKLKPVIVITKADSDKEKIFKKDVSKITGIKPIEVCSVNKIIGLGKNKREIEGYGREEIIQNILTNSVESFKERFKYIKNGILSERAKNGKIQIMHYVKKEIKSVESFINNIAESDTKKILNMVDYELKSYDFVTERMIDKLILDAEDFYKDKILLSYKNGRTPHHSLSTIMNKPNIEESIDFLDIILTPFLMVPYLIEESWLYLSDESKYDFEERVRKIVNEHFNKSYYNIHYEVNS